MFKLIKRFKAFYATHRAVVNVAFALMLALSVSHIQALFSPARAASFSIDLGGVLSTAADLFNGLFPVFALILGITVGLGIVTMVVDRVSRAFGRG